MGESLLSMSVIYGGNSSGKAITETAKPNSRVALDVSMLQGGEAGSFATLQKTVATSGTPEQLAADASIDPGVKVVIKAEADNAGTVTIGNSSANALNSGTDHFKLPAGAAVELYISNLNKVWLDVTSNGDGVEVIYET